MKSVPAIAFDYRTSSWLLSSTAIVAVLALVSISLCGLGLALKFALTALTATYVVHVLGKLRHPPFVQVVWQSAGYWRLSDEGGREQVGELVRAVALGASITLVLRTGPKRTTAFVLLPDNCAAEIQRKLRVRLARVDSIDASR
jgi:toxin CptA